PTLFLLHLFAAHDLRSPRRLPPLDHLHKQHIVLLLLAILHHNHLLSLFFFIFFLLIHHLRLPLLPPSPLRLHSRRPLLLLFLFLLLLYHNHSRRALRWRSLGCSIHGCVGRCSSGGSCSPRQSSGTGCCSPNMPSGRSRCSHLSSGRGHRTCYCSP
ncbi:hypothetical protein PFISCL1PPCAC_8663, partial [Pristionchus fissidentatus]